MTNLEAEVIELKVRVERLEATLHQLAGKNQNASLDLDDFENTHFENIVTLSASNSTHFELEDDDSLDQEQLLNWLKAEGLIAEPPAMAKDHAERWQALAEEQRQAVREALNHLPPGPMASDIIIETRR
jgi:hypothetical protein